MSYTPLTTYREILLPTGSLCATFNQIIYEELDKMVWDEVTWQNQLKAAASSILGALWKNINADLIGAE